MSCRAATIDSSESLSMTPSQAARSRYTVKAYDPQRSLQPDQVEQLLDVLRLSASSVNSQPWHHVVALGAEGRERIARATHGPYAYNAAKVRQAAAVIVLCTRQDLTEEHLAAVLAQEAADGRFASDEARANQDRSRRGYVEQHRQAGDTREWMARQVYLALGGLLQAAATLGIGATPMEGFDGEALDAELGLMQQGYTSLVLCALGWSAAEDFNARLPKSRLPREQVFSFI